MSRPRTRRQAEGRYPARANSPATLQEAPLAYNPAPPPVATPPSHLHFLDLFAGCGGFSLGFTAAGFKCVGGVEIDDFAHDTHVHMFPSPYADPVPRDIRDVDAAAFQPERLGQLPPPRLIIGGPPCQPFTRVGRAKLREVAKNAAAHIHDERVTFYEHYLRFVDQLRPLAFVMENVPDLCRFAGRNIAEEVAVTAEELGYEVRYTLLNAAWYGVPQMRERVFVIGLRKELGQLPLFPPRTHTLKVPRGYWTGRLSNGDIPVLPPHGHYATAAEEIINAAPALIASDAVSDLPRITEHMEHMQARKGARRFSNPLAYTCPPANHYQELMRSWPGLHAPTPPPDHVIRFTPRDYETFRRMKPGDQYPQGFQVALARLEEALRREEKASGSRPREGGQRYEDLKRTIVPPYDSEKFPNKWRKMDPNAPARTIPAHIGKDSYSHIHYDSSQARMISVREAARLQSFPDAFRFQGSMNHAFRQIGNSVPPLLAYAVATSVKRQLIAAGALSETKTQPLNGISALLAKEDS